MKNKIDPNICLPPANKPDRMCTLPELWSRHRNEIAEFRKFQEPDVRIIDYTRTLNTISETLSKVPACELSAFDIYIAITSVRTYVVGGKIRQYADSIYSKRLAIIRDIYKVGVPSILLGSLGSVLTYLINLILGAFSTVAIAVYGVYFKLQSFVFMPVFGLNNGIVPIVAYNYGAKYKDRIIKSIKLCAFVALAIMIVGMLIFIFFPVQLLGMFSPNEEMLRIGVSALRIIAIHFPLAAIGITFTSVFQAFGRGLLSMFASFTRQLIGLLPAAWLLSLTGNVNNIWWAFPIAEVISLIACIIAMKNVYKTQIKTL